MSPRDREEGRNWFQWFMGSSSRGSGSRKSRNSTGSNGSYVPVPEVLVRAREGGSRNEVARVGAIANDGSANKKSTVRLKPDPTKEPALGTERRNPNPRNQNLEEPEPREEPEPLEPEP